MVNPCNQNCHNYTQPPTITRGNPLNDTRCITTGKSPYMASTSGMYKDCIVRASSDTNCKYLQPCVPTTINMQNAKAKVNPPNESTTTACHRPCGRPGACDANWFEQSPKHDCVQNIGRLFAIELPLAAPAPVAMLVAQPKPHHWLLLLWSSVATITLGRHSRKPANIPLKTHVAIEPTRDVIRNWLPICKKNPIELTFTPAHHFHTIDTAALVH